MRTSVGLVSLDEVPDDLDDCDGTCCPGGGLCCPDDPLDEVMRCLPALDDGFLEALGAVVVAPSPPRHQDQPPPPPALSVGGGEGEGEGACGVDADGDVRMLAVGSGPVVGGGGGGEGAFGVDAGGGVGVPAEGSAPAGFGGGGVERDVCGLLGGAPEVQEAAFDVDMFFADDAPDDATGCGGGRQPNVCQDMSCRTAATTLASPVGGLNARVAPGGGFVSDGALQLSAHDTLLLPAHEALPVPTHVALPLLTYDTLPLRAHDAPSAWPLPTSAKSSGSLSSTTTSETEPPPAPVYPPYAWGTRKPRRGPARRRSQNWLKNFMLADVAPRRKPSHKASIDGEQGCDDNANASRQRPSPRQRNRQTQRACSHCGNTETPQWRTGPDGPGTLCNACGIRFTAKKLLPEYRPSTSPSFKSGEHSNRHRKVVKLREKKEKEKLLKMMANAVPAAPNHGEFMDVCTYISTG
ncbi:hypothetical protein ACP70R_004090 [Stipagrostis hirtigluma subsp. patula]